MVVDDIGCGVWEVKVCLLTGRADKVAVGLSACRLGSCALAALAEPQSLGWSREGMK